jgi:hypothetical protein
VVVVTVVGWHASHEQTPERLREVIGGFRDNGGDGKPALLHVHVSWARADDGAHRS